ncbi:MAG: SDR family oxidoreductase, partial [Pseudomonadota bacterium]
MAHLERFELNGRVAAVTGAGRGLGRVMALDIVRSGGRVAIGSRTVSELEKLKAEIESMGGECHVCELDVTSVDSIQRFVDSTVTHYGRLDVMVNNAGFGRVGPILDCDEDLYDAILDTNLKSVFFGSKIAAQQMIQQGGGGCIINISSQAGVVAAPGRGAYSGAKAGVNNFTRTAAAEWAPHQIRVNVIAPTVTRSPMAEQAVKDSEEFAQMVRDKI